jgi:hypothetical protein
MTSIQLDIPNVFSNVNSIRVLLSSLKYHS